jgi:hypothetical protein
MRILALLVFASFILVSCKKEVGYANTNTNNNNNNNNTDTGGTKTDTTDLGKFIKATGITDEILKADLDTLIMRAKSHGWWDLCKAIYPLAGGTSSGASFNLKDTAAYQLTWSGSPVFSNAGATFDGVSYGNTGINDSILAYNNAHISFFSNSDDTTIDQWVMGVDDGTVPYNEFSITNAGFKQAVAYFFTGNGTFSTIQSSTIGWYLVSSGITDVRIYKDGSDITSTTESPVDSHANNTFLIGKSRGLAGTNTQCAFATIGSNIDSTIAALMYSDIRDFVNEK